eukprot:1375433-Pleurochrysis_carterae.AAC.1
MCIRDSSATEEKPAAAPLSEPQQSSVERPAPLSQVKTEYPEWPVQSPYGLREKNAAQEEVSSVVEEDDAEQSLANRKKQVRRAAFVLSLIVACLLYTSDAADDTPCVDL